MVLSNDSPFFRLMSLMGSLIWVNVLALVCCLPVVTAGASLTAAHYVCLRIVRGDDYQLTRGFFSSFTQNFRQATLIWLLLLLVGALLAGDVYLMDQQIVQVPKVAEILIYLVCALWTGLTVTVFSVLARFDNTIWGALKNAMALSLIQLPKTVLAAVLSVLPFILLLWNPSLLPVPLFFGISAPIYLHALMYSKLFLQLEAQSGGSDDCAIAEEAAGTEEDL